MSFPWLEADIPERVRATFYDKAMQMYRDEVRQRARLLMQLGWSEAEVARRCRQNLRWDFDLSGRCKIEGEVNALVKEIFRRH